MMTWQDGYGLVCFAMPEDDDVVDDVSSLEHPTSSIETRISDRTISDSLPRMRRLVFVLALALAGCHSCGAEKGQSAAATAVPDVHVSVERPDQPPFMLDGEVLAKHEVDRGDPPWLAWKLKNVAPHWDDRAPVDVVDDEGFRSPLLRSNEAPGDLEALLLVGPKGESRIVRLPPGKPITAHQGENRKDAGRVRHVAKLVFVDPDAGGTSGPLVSLKVVVAGKETTWTRDELSKVTPIVFRSKDGDGERDAWPLRALTKALVGENAMPTEVVGEEKKSTKIDPAKWKDPSIEPVIRASRRGKLKLQWLDAKSHEEAEDLPQLRGVRELRFP